MKVQTLITFSVVLCCAALPKLHQVKEAAATCNPEECKLPDCFCSGTEIPGGLSPQEVPQLVYFTFDDAVSVINTGYYEKAFSGRKNPDGCPVGATYFVSHEYTNYESINKLYSEGHEIALHSITHTPLTDYWKSRTVDQLADEFGGERDLVSHFAAIPKESIHGMRLPLLQLSGDNSYVAAKQVGLSYDCSWPSKYVEPGLWPYTLDYASSQDCLSPPCPESSLPGFWVQPMLHLHDDENFSCAMVDACTNIPDDVESILNFFKRNFLIQYEGNRAPFGLYMHAAWFGKLEHAFEAYVQFIDYLQTLEDVYLVGISRGLEWVRNPVKLNSETPLWPSCQRTDAQPCKAVNCRLLKGKEERYMNSCAKCPRVYPWIGNALGQ